MKRVVKSNESVMCMAKELSKGVFWLIDGELLTFPFLSAATDGIAKSGTTYNHKKLWNHIKPKGVNKPYNYYPRGRVDITNKGKAVVYLNPNIDESFLSQIKSDFELIEKPEVRYDYSEHYKCYLDDGWKAEY